MEKSVTVGEMFNYNMEVNQLSHGVLGILLRSKIRQFWNDNRIRIESYADRLESLQREYLEFDGDEIKKDKDGNPVLLDKSKSEEYDEKFKAFLNQQTVIRI